MKQFFCLVILAVFLNGCSTAPSGENAIRTNADISELNNPDPNSLPQTNANNSLSGSLTTFGANNQMSGEKKLANKNAAPLDPNAKPITQPAPDNSEFQSMMNNQGQPVESRVFKNHPALLKVERIYTDLENPVVKIYLKNGKTMNLPADKIGNPMEASAAEIMNTLGADNSLPGPTKQP
jgi:hypothetical protein